MKVDWISVKDRLPENDRLVWAVSNGLPAVTRFAYGKWEVGGVTRWMEIEWPELPGVEGADGITVFKGLGNISEFNVVPHRLPFGTSGRVQVTIEWEGLSSNIPTVTIPDELDGLGRHFEFELVARPWRRKP